MKIPKLTPAQSLSVALIAALSRGDIATATRIVNGTDDLAQLALHCATMAARGTSATVWENFLAVIARDEAEALQDSLEE